MEVRETCLDGVFEIQNKLVEDSRGLFVKTFNSEVFRATGLQTDFEESFYSKSKKNVLRGMHFQLPPYDHAKLVYVVHGEILDVVVDIQKNSRTFGKCYSTVLSCENSRSIYMEKGFAHGFLTLSESATVVYMVDSVYNPSADSGVKWNSIEFQWPIENPILSPRDQGFSAFSKDNVLFD
jgi:dTDP-4-dehydrorhamnose 3,5-epimerase